MQCHVEMTPELIRTWCADWDKELQSLATRTPSVQTPQVMLADVAAKTNALHATAGRLYSEWIKGLKKI